MLLQFRQAHHMKMYFAGLKARAHFYWDELVAHDFSKEQAAMSGFSIRAIVDRPVFVNVVICADGP